MRTAIRSWLAAGLTVTGVLAMASVALSGAALGNETVTYNYDAKGRLVTVVHDGDVNDNLQSNYTFDDADNRKTVTTIGAPAAP